MKIIYFILCIFCPVALMAQRSRLNHGLSKKKTTSSINLTMNRYEDSLKLMIQEYDSIPKKDEVGLPDNPYLFRMFSPLTFYSDPIQRTFGFSNTDGSSKQDSCLVAMDRSLMLLYMQHPDWVQYTEKDISDVGGFRSNVVKRKKETPQISVKTEKINLDDIEKDNVQIITHKPNFWKFGGSYSLQFMQNYVSDNWYKGGESNHSMLAMVNFSAVYNNKQKVKFENSLDLKLGFQYFKSDKIHRYRTTSDQIRMVNKLGLQAFSHWYYTLLLQSWTQFYPGYRNNQKRVYSDFMSPFESVFSIGMEYKLNVKNFNMSANISPFACDFKYVDRLALSRSFGLDDKKHTKFDYGSNITINANWRILKNVSWNSRVYYYTNYSSSRFEWENTYTFTINKYLSTKLFLYPRFDDNVYKKDESYFQFKEWMSLGLSMSF